MSAALSETPRDRDLCLFVYAYDGCSVALLHRRFWPSGASLRAAYGRLHRLIETGYLAAIRLPSLSGVGSGKLFLTLGPRGRQLVAGIVGTPIRQLRAAVPPSSPLFAEHHFAVSATRLAIEEAVRQLPAFRLEEWRTDRLLHQHPPGRVTVGGRRVTVIPDAAFRLSYQNRSEEFFLEQDRATVHAERVRAKLRAYLALAATSSSLADHTQRAEGRNGTRMRPVLWVTPDPARAATVVGWAVEEGRRLGLSPAAIWATSEPQLASSPVAALAAPIWQVAGGPPVAILALAAGSAGAAAPPSAEARADPDRSSAIAVTTEADGGEDRDPAG